MSHAVRGCPYPYDQCKCDQYEEATEQRRGSLTVGERSTARVVFRLRSGDSEEAPK